MPKYNKYLVTSLLLSLLSVSAYAKTTNDFCIKGDWQSMTFNLDSYFVTGGKLLSIENGKLSDKTCVRVIADRKNSVQVMTWINNITNNGIAIPAAFNKDVGVQTPSQANFAFTGTMRLIAKNGQVLICPNFLIAQTGAYTGVSGNVWFFYTNNASPVIKQCFDETGNQQDISLQPANQDVRIVVPVNSVDDEVSATGSSFTANNTIRMTIK